MPVVTLRTKSGFVGFLSLFTLVFFMSADPNVVYDFVCSVHTAGTALVSYLFSRGAFCDCPIQTTHQHYALPQQQPLEKHVHQQYCNVSA